MRRPLIGITGRRLPSCDVSSLEARYRRTSVDLYFSDFAQKVAAAGGLPVEIPYETDAEELMLRLDGLLLSGGQDVQPSRWGGDATVARGSIDVDRDAMELNLVKHAVEAAVPVLGVCRGAQVINTALGGSLVGDLPTAVIDHTSPSQDVAGPHHAVEFAEGTLAHRLYGKTADVNSLHHQAIDACGEGVIISGRAPDGAAESIEVPGLPLLGVQWHPEWLSEPDPAFRWLVHMALDRAFGCHDA